MDLFIYINLKMDKYFKLFNFGVICYVTLENKYSYIFEKEIKLTHQVSSCQSQSLWSKGKSIYRFSSTRPLKLCVHESC